ncbi:MAG: DUF481 domain-containing protein [Colwellia sp.]|nr:DUF481 domain-containing protein [Colwellia sp.]
MNNALRTIYLTLIFLPILTLPEVAAQSSKTDWQTPSPIFKQKFDWLRLTSNEWLKGDIVSMYDETLEFDSDELDMQTIDWDDVAELRSKDWLSIRLVDGTIAEGYLVVLDGKLTLVNNNISTNYHLNELVSIASSGVNEWDLWDGYANVGLNVRSGNTEQLDYTITAGIQRRSSSSRFKTDYTANYSKSEIDDDGVPTDVKTADSQRLTSTYDWYFSQKIFFRVVDAEYFSDEFLNVDSRISVGVGLGYQLIDSSKTSWEVTLGPSYQTTRFNNVKEGEDDQENSAVVSIGTTYEYELTSDIDFDASYQIQLVNEASGDKIHHFKTGFEVEFAGDFDLDLTFYLDRTEKPKEDESENIPEQNDYRFVVSLGYDF